MTKSFKSFLTVFIFAAYVGGFPRILLAQNFVEPTVTIYATDSHASEAGSETGTFTVRRTGATNFPLAVFYQLSGSASNGVDYEHLGSSVQIPAGALEASLIVKPIDDSLVEGNESVAAQITGSPLDCATCGYTIGVPSFAEVTVDDNDLGGTNHPPFVQLNAPRDGDVFRAPAFITLQAYAQDTEEHYNLMVEFFAGTNSLGFGAFEPTLCPAPYCPYYALTWSNVPPGEYTLRAKATDSQGATGVSAVVHVFVTETNVVQQPVVNIYAIDDTGSEIPVVPPWLGLVQRSDPAVFSVTRTGPTNFPMTVFYNVGGTASNGVDYFGSDGFYEGLPGRVTIPTGASSANIDVWVIDDFLVEGTETVELTLQPPACIQIFPPPPDCYIAGPSSHAIASILDNDVTPAPVVTIVATDPDASENGANTGRFTFSRTGDTSNPLPVFYTVGGTAQMGVDYLTDSNFDSFLKAFGLINVVIPAGASSTDIIVTPIDDALAEGSEAVVLQLQPQPWAPYLLGFPSNAVVTIADNDTGSNLPPVVRMVRPADGETFPVHSDIQLVAFAQDPEDGYYVHVEFFEGTHTLGFGTFFPGRCAVCPNYGITWSNMPPGEYVLRAKATDSHGAMTVSDSIHIRVTGTNAPVLQFLEPTNNAVFSTLDEIPIVLRSFAPDDVFPTADVLANGARIATASYCCWLCPCFAPLPGQELILQIPVPREDGMPWTRTWQGWTNVHAGSYRLTARATGENGTMIESAPVNITVLDLTLRISVRPDGTVILVIREGSLLAGGYDAEASQDLRTWTRLGPFQPGNEAAFYYDDPPAGVRRFYRSVRVAPRQP
jgi:hypothetical protein